jgi:hypothetical protein
MGVDRKPISLLMVLANKAMTAILASVFGHEGSSFLIVHKALQRSLGLSD